MKQPKILAVLFALAIIQTPAFANSKPAQLSVSSDVSTADNRMARRLGAYVGIFGDPHPTMAGFNIAYNITEYMRASVGFGKVSVSTVSLDDSLNFSAEDKSMTTLGAAVKFLMPNWNLSPAVTVGYSHVALDEGMLIADYKTNNIYLGLGADWQAANGFNLGAGMNLSVNSGAPTAPYVNVGMFF